MNPKLLKLLEYGNTPVCFRSVLSNGKHYRKLYDSVNVMIGDKKNVRLSDEIELITVQQSLLDDKKFILIDAIER